MARNDRVARILADIENLRDAATDGSNEQHQWEIAFFAVQAARCFGEGKLAEGLSQARMTAAAIAGH